MHNLNNKKIDIFEGRKGKPIYDTPNPSLLDILSIELLVCIFKFLTWNDLLTLLSANKYIHEIVACEMNIFFSDSEKFYIEKLERINKSFYSSCSHEVSKYLTQIGQIVLIFMPDDLTVSDCQNVMLAFAKYLDLIQTIDNYIDTHKISNLKVIQI